MSTIVTGSGESPYDITLKTKHNEEAKPSKKSDSSGILHVCEEFSRKNLPLVLHKTLNYFIYNIPKTQTIINQ